MARERPMRSALLALLYGAGGAFSLLNAAWPMRPDSPVVVGWFIGVLAVALAATLWWRGARLTDVEVHLALVLGAGMVAVLASQSMTAVGVVALGPIIITICLYAGWFLPLPAARAHALFTLLLTSAGAWLAAPRGSAGRRPPIRSPGWSTAVPGRPRRAECSRTRPAPGSR